MDTAAPAPGIVERTIAYSIRIVKLYRALERDSVGRVLGKQLLRSGTSVGANVHESQVAQSTADFLAKLYIAFKEARETAYWLRLVGETSLVSQNRLKPLCDETEQIVRILSSIILTTKQKRKRGGTGGR